MWGRNMERAVFSEISVLFFFKSSNLGVLVFRLLYNLIIAMASHSESLISLGFLSLQYTAVRLTP